MRLVRTDSDSEALSDAARTVASDDSVAGVLLLATPSDDLSAAALDPVLQNLPVPVFGGVFPKLLHEGETVGDGALVVGLSLEPTVTVVPSLSDPDRRYEESLTEAPFDRGDGTAFVFVDAFSRRIEDFVTALFRTYGTELTFLGGGAGSLDAESSWCLFTDDGVRDDAALFVTLETDSRVGVRHGWREIAGPFRVTDASGRTLSTLDGDRAADVYERAVENDSGRVPTPETFFEVAKSYPFGISRLDAEKVVRDPYEVTDDGSLECFGAVPEGEFVHLLRGDPEALVDAAGGAYEDATAGAEPDDPVLFFDCISRVLYLEDDFERELAAVGDESTPAFGALTIGEVANGGEGHLEYYNKTAVVGVVDEL